MIGSLCSCGARYEAFRATGDAGRALTFGDVHAMLVVGSHDPELWRPKSRAAVLRLWGQLKRDQWEVTHGYCASAAQAAIDSSTEDGDTSFDVATFDNAAVVPAPSDHCGCDHCIAARAVGAEPPAGIRRPRALRCRSPRSPGDLGAADHVVCPWCASGISPASYRG